MHRYFFYDTSSQLRILPKEILHYIFSFIAYKDLCRLAQVCKGLNVLSLSPALWKNFFLQHFGENPLTTPFDNKPLFSKRLWFRYLDISKDWSGRFWKKRFSKMAKNKTFANRPIKLVIVGTPKSGKSSFFKRQITGEFDRKYSADEHANNFLLTYFTTLDINTQFDLWDINGDYWDLYCINADAALIFYDVSNIKSQLAVEKYYQGLKRISPEMIIAVCGNKHDSYEGKPLTPCIQLDKFLQKKLLLYCTISCKVGGSNINEPLLQILRQLYCSPQLEEREIFSCGLYCFSCSMDPEKLAEYERELLLASSMTLPDDDEDL